ncbi:hypothetical protein ACFW1A_34375 [Kitasatospora sp. NPDC058965]|uniref:hypothetical protein n=1 Tax=Kitasatospora sp. NPDC058965 TaxID=3346682 RepID=UPI0036811358
MPTPGWTGPAASSWTAPSTPPPCGWSGVTPRRPAALRPCRCSTRPSRSAWTRPWAARRPATATPRT